MSSSTVLTLAFRSRRDRISSIVPSSAALRSASSRSGCEAMIEPNPQRLTHRQTESSIREQEQRARETQQQQQKRSRKETKTSRCCFFVSFAPSLSPSRTSRARALSRSPIESLGVSVQWTSSRQSHPSSPSSSYATHGPIRPRVREIHARERTRGSLALAQWDTRFLPSLLSCCGCSSLVRSRQLTFKVRD